MGGHRAFFHRTRSRPNAGRGAAGRFYSEETGKSTRRADGAHPSMEVAMVLRNFIAPSAVVLFVSAIAYAAAIAGVRTDRGAGPSEVNSR